MDVGGESYIMQLSPHALSLMKRETGMGFKALLAKLQEQDDDPDFELIGIIIWAMTQDHHPELSIIQAAGLYPAGGLEEIVEKMQAVFTAAFPKQSAAQQVAANPPKATKGS